MESVYVVAGYIECTCECVICKSCIRYLSEYIYIVYKAGESASFGSTKEKL